MGSAPARGSTLPLGMSAIASWGVPLLLLALLAWTLRELARSIAPLRHVLAGRYAEAHDAAARMGRSPLRVFPSIRNGSRYMRALALHLQGDLEASLEAVAPLPFASLDRNLRYAARSLEAANLVLLEREPARALESIDAAIALWRASGEDLLLRALALHALGRTDEAEREYARSLEVTRGAVKLGARTALVEDRATKDAMTAYLRARYLRATARPEEARAHLERAAAHGKPHVYARLARERLPAREPEEDGRSSLAPQVVARDQGASETPSSEKRNA